MKKLFKSISVLVLSLALTVSGLTFVQPAKADQTSDWQASAVKTPKEGSLVGAGYIEVEFDNSLPGYTYEVLLDGNSVYWKDGNILRPELGEDETQGTIKTFSSSDTPKTEVYTTDVASHQITVKATDTNDQTITSDPVTFYVSKKGLAMGDNMGTKVSLKKLNCSWYYNWGTKAFNNSVDDGVQHSPMIWGQDSLGDISNLDSEANYVLGFNEPDIPSQANMNFWDAVGIWNSHIKPINKRKVSPAPARPGGSPWLEDFIEGEYVCNNTWLNDGSLGLYEDYKDDASKQWVDGIGPDNVDAVCLHYYMPKINVQGLISAVDSLWNRYHKPVWITEIGIFGTKDTASDYSYEKEDIRTQMHDYLEYAVEQLDSRAYVERYCWFSYDVDSTNEIDGFDGSGATAMFEYATGKYTDLGMFYSSVGNPNGYNANVITENQKFDWNNRVKTDINYDNKENKVQVSWSTGTLEDVSKVKILLDENTCDVVNGGMIDTASLDLGNHIVRFAFYDGDNNTIIEKARAFEITEKNITTQEPTTVVTSTNSTIKPTQSIKTKPSKIVLRKVKNSKKKSVILNWKKARYASKYKVQWALNKKFTKKLKTKITSALNYKVKGLKKKKTYFFRVAGVNGSGVGAWSSVKKIKIKK